jgi:hypothetical protein
MSTQRRYEFRNAQSGLICCSTDDPQLLCAQCKALLSAGTTQTRRLPTTARAMELRTTAKAPCQDHETACPFHTPGYSPRGTPPNGYAPATDRAPQPLDPRADPGYRSHGEPADPYELARRDRAKKENER